MNRAPDRLKTAIALNALVVLLEIAAIASSFGRNSMLALEYYTVLSNMFGCIACIMCLAAEVRQLRGGPQTPHAIRLVKYAASCTLLMTLFVVVFVLAPMLISIGQNGYYLMFFGFERPVTHLVAPLLVFASYVLFEADRSMTFRQSLVGFVPTLIYAAVAYPCNILRLWDGPYPFLQVWGMPLWQTTAWFIALCALAIGLCQIPRLVGRKVRV